VDQAEWTAGAVGEVTVLERRLLGWIALERMSAEGKKFEQTSLSNVDWPAISVQPIVNQDDEEKRGRILTLLHHDCKQSACG
jgi:hypothetical protein